MRLMCDLRHYENLSRDLAIDFPDIFDRELTALDDRWVMAGRKKPASEVMTGPAVPVISPCGSISSHQRPKQFSRTI
jgi:hypothetical protein